MLFQKPVQCVLFLTVDRKYKILYNLGSTTLEITMNQYRVQVRTATADWAFVIISASYDYDAKNLAEAQYGAHNIISITRYYG